MLLSLLNRRRLSAASPISPHRLRPRHRRPCSASSTPTSSPTPQPPASFAAVAILAAAPSACQSPPPPPPPRPLYNGPRSRIQHLQPSSYQCCRLARCRVMPMAGGAALLPGVAVAAQCPLFDVAHDCQLFCQHLLSAILSALNFVPYPMSMPMRSASLSSLLSLSVPHSVPRSLSSPSLCLVPCPSPSPCSSVQRVLCDVSAKSLQHAHTRSAAHPVCLSSRLTTSRTLIRTIPALSPMGKIFPQLGRQPFQVCCKTRIPPSTVSRANIPLLEQAEA